MPSGPNNDLALIKSKVSLPDLAKLLGVRVLVNRRLAHCFNPKEHRNGDANPSLQLHEDGFKCHGCGITGDAFDLVKHIEGGNFEDAKKRLSALAGVDLASASAYKPKSRRAVSPALPPTAVTWPKGRLDIHQEVWKIVKDVPLTGEAKAWLVSREITPAIAHEIGCRDFAPVAQEIGDLLKGLPETLRRESGFFSTTGHLWGPLQSILTKGQSTGLCFPSIVPGYDFPLSWRWRLYKPFNGRNGPVKVLAQPSAGVPIMPLGLDRVTMFSGPVIICEGEPDFLSLLEASLRVGKPVEVVGICDMASGWRNEWTPHLSQATRVIVATHDMGNGYKLATQVGVALTGHFGKAHAEKVFGRYLFDENQDANDMLKAGSLELWLNGVLTNG